MKKSLIALAVLGAFAGVASAQSTVTLYGVADANISFEKNYDDTNKSIAKMKSGGLNGSRWGLRVVEDLGGGLKANAVMESGFNIDEGTSGQGSRLFGRQAYVGLMGDFGAVRLGRQYTPIGAFADEFGTKGYDILTLAKVAAADESGVSGVALYRVNNALTYMTPNFSGFTMQAQYSFGYTDEGATNTSSSNGTQRNFGLSGTYSNGPIMVGAAYHHVLDKTSADGNQRRRAGLIGGSYDFGMAKLKAYYSIQGTENTGRQKVLGASVDFPFNPFTLSLGVAGVRDQNGLKNADDNATIFTVQGVYDLSKRTAAYMNIFMTNNGELAKSGYSGTPANENASGFQFGVRHRF